MKAIRINESWLKAAIFAALAVTYLAQAFARRGLFGDSTCLLVNILTEGSLYRQLIAVWTDFTRIGTYALIEFPLIVALKLGLTNLKIILVLFSSWVTFVSLGLWAAALWKARHANIFWPVALMFAAIYFQGNAFATGEYVVCYALAAFCFVSLLIDDDSRAGRIALLIASIFFVATYTATLFLGPVLAVLAFRRYQASAARGARIYWGVLMFLYGASMAVAIWGYLHPQFIMLLKRARSFDGLRGNFEFLISLTFAELIAFLWLANLKRWAMPRAIVAACFFLIAAVVYFYPWPYWGHAVRIYTGLALFLFCCGIAYFKIHGATPMPREEARSYDNLKLTCMLPIALMIFVLCGEDISCSIKFKRYIDHIEVVINSTSGILPYEDVVKPMEDGDFFNWDWVYPAMSFLLRNNENGAVIQYPRLRFWPYRYKDAENPPDLSRYYKSN